MSSALLQYFEKKNYLSGEGTCINSSTGWHICRYQLRESASYVSLCESYSPVCVCW